MSALLKVLTFVAFLVLSNYVFYDRVLEMYSLGKLKNLGLFLGVWGVCFLGIFSAWQHTSKKIRIFFGLIFAINTALGMTYFAISEHYLSYQDVELMWISRANAGDAIGFYINEISKAVGVALLGFITFLLKPIHFLRFESVKAVLLMLFPFFLLMAVTVVKKGYGTEGMPQQMSPLSTFLLYQGYELLLPDLIGKRDVVEINPNYNGTPKNIVYIVDESIRADYLDMNLDRGITPFLSTQISRISNFGSMASGNNCSGFSNLILRSGVNPKELTRVGKLPLIWAYAKNAGYKTHYFDAQQTDGLLQNFMTKKEMELVDNFQQLDKGSEAIADHVFAQKIQNVLKTSERNFIYFNKRGAHFPYFETYPPMAAKYTPHMELGDDLGEDKNKLVNSYMNSVSWTVDEFFKILLATIDLKDTIIFYTSDHGQNLMDRGIMTHCNTTDPHPYEGFVPFMVLTDNPTYKSKYDEIAKASYNKLTHFHLFASVLEAFGYEEKDISKHNRYNLKGPYVEDRAFTLGSIIPRFGEDVKWYGINNLKFDSTSDNAN